MKISEMFIDDTYSLGALLELKWDGKIGANVPKDTLSKLEKYGLITTSPAKLTEVGDLIITRLIINGGMD